MAKRVVAQGARLLGGMPMGLAIILGFLAGLFGANGVPHFVRGITGESYLCLLGNSAIPNLVAGWASFVAAALLLQGADSGRHLAAMEVSAAIGALLIGLFHAAGLAFGRKR
jgi:hypothetical protein